MEFKDNIPIYFQIEQYLYRQIAMGKLKAGEKIPSVRKLALELTVNVNTVQRALQEMNAQQILYTKRGEGNFVTEDTELLAKTKQSLIDNELDEFVQNMEKLGVKRQNLASTLEDYLKRSKDHE
ncbi:GntR family transcriptional regulator [Lactobacillus kefiranofaciens]|uniref:GntR family transcriptional regulator n=1 Tax=Lactobacillus kefiranofaciens TaxID=267818 RepID=A0AAX3UFV0_9LACO|nr:GntR family transcriptional regulator [Lactobacillus kefiranofaciens]AEG40190.1 Transcriptional regulator [Lactobacillus kefiranofaciens subsp. kefiranofaciens]KRL29281.1 ArsR family transcriptional regulator [Lactobacillus kefiranofaciens subsp. kefirgranum DSM 10550 = JCM 8572]KRM23072.1 ArsR family transcriptional regulator [Lactobacillus kefiranofaciens subsp. kefiranofaciens DSM 5016 = JCM 6985]MCJ2171409.1 GntR family transcriptional regulator [Lactobacillus kefiranofaciens]MCP9330134